MKYKSILKIIVIIFLICINYTFSFAQVDDSIFMDNNSKVIILGIKKFENLVLLSLKNKPYCTRDREQVYVVTEKEHIKLFSYSKNDFKYSVFDTNCYIITWDPFPTFVRDYIIPNAPSKYLPILNKTYPNRFIIAENLGRIVDEKIVYYERYKYQNIKYKNFMIYIIERNC